MKKLINTSIIMLGLLAGLSSCKKEANVINTSAPVASTTKMEPSSLTRGSWYISSFQWQTRQPNTAFAGYEFKFTTSGEIYARKDDRVYRGKWSIEEPYMMINFGTLSPMNQLNCEKWYITQQTVSTLTMRGLNPVDNKSQYIVFRRKSF